MKSLSQPLSLSNLSYQPQTAPHNYSVRERTDFTFHVKSQCLSHSAFHIILKSKYFVTILNFLLYFKKLVIYSTWSFKSFGTKFNQNCMWILSKLSFLLSLSFFLYYFSSRWLTRTPTLNQQDTFIIWFIWLFIY